MIAAHASRSSPQGARNFKRSVSKVGIIIALVSFEGAADDIRVPSNRAREKFATPSKAALLQVDHDRIRTRPQFEFGRVEWRLAEGRTGVVREAELLERQAQPIHVEFTVAVEVLKQLDRIDAGFDPL